MSHRIAKRFAGVAIEDLKLAGLARGDQAQAVYDAAWTQIASMLDYEAAKAGGRIVRVDPPSHTCRECAIIKSKARGKETHRCGCGCVLDRDVAADCSFSIFWMAGATGNVGTRSGVAALGALSKGSGSWLAPEVACGSGR